MEAAQTEHGDIGYWNRVTDVNYEDGQYCGTLQEPPTVHVVDFSGYDGPLDENGFPVGLPNEIAEYMKQHGMISNVWTVNHPVDMIWAMRQKIDFLTTDRPDLFLQLQGK